MWEWSVKKANGILSWGGDSGYDGGGGSNLVVR